jgi:O-antigen ligase
MPILAILALIFSGTLYKSVDVVYLLIVFVGGYALYSIKERLPFELRFFYALALLLILVISLSVFMHDWHSFFQWRFSAFQLLIFIPFIGMFTYFVFDSEEVFWRVLIFSSLFSFVWLALVLFHWPVQRDTGYLSDAINRGNMGMLFGLMAMVAFFAVSDKKWKLLAVIGFFSGVVLSIISGSRGGWLALLISSFTLTFIFFKFKKETEFKTLFYIQIFLLICLILFWKELPIQGRVHQAMIDINKYLDGNPYSSVGYRFELWKASFYAFLEKPILGWGWTNFDMAQEFVMNNGEIARIRHFGHPHNQYFLFLVETGLVGLLTLLAFMLWPFIVSIRYIKKSTQLNSTVYLAVLVMIVTESILEFSLTDDSFSQKYFIFVFLFISCFSLLKMNEKYLK